MKSEKVEVGLALLMTEIDDTDKIDKNDITSAQEETTGADNTIKANVAGLEVKREIGVIIGILILKGLTAATKIGDKPPKIADLVMHQAFQVSSQMWENQR